MMKADSSHLVVMNLVLSISIAVQ